QTANGKQQTAGDIQLSQARRQRSAGTAGVSPASTRARTSHGRTISRPPQAPLPTANRPLPTSLWHRIDSDVNGEWTYYLILDEFLKSPAESKRAAAGWAGDRYALYEGANGQIFLAQLAAWDTEADAREFFDAYLKRTELRYPGAKKVELAGLTQNSDLETRNMSTWQTSEGLVT